MKIEIGDEASRAAAPAKEVTANAKPFLLKSPGDTRRHSFIQTLCENTEEKNPESLHFDEAPYCIGLSSGSVYNTVSSSFLRSADEVS